MLKDDKFGLFNTYLQSNFNSANLSLTLVALFLNLHPNYLSEWIKKGTGIHFTVHLNRYRMDKAMELLSVSSHLTIEQIAKRVGFENTRHFFKVFRRYAGTTPGEYRRIYGMKQQP